MRKCEDKQNSPWRVHPLRDDFTIKIFQSVGNVERKKKKKNVRYNILLETPDNAHFIGTW